MLLNELFNSSKHYKGYHSDKLDNSQLRMTDVRKTRLTLEQINRLRIMRDTRDFEFEQKLVALQAQYSTKSEEPIPGF